MWATEQYSLLGTPLKPVAVSGGKSMDLMLKRITLGASGGYRGVTVCGRGGGQSRILCGRGAHFYTGSTFTTVVCHVF